MLRGEVYQRGLTSDLDGLHLAPVRRLLIVLVVLFLMAVTGAVGAWWWVESAGTKPLIAQDVVFEVPKGASGPKLPKLLHEAKLLESVLPAQYYLKLHPAFPKFGKHQLTRGMTLSQVTDALAGTPIPDDVAVTIIEGWRLIDTDTELASWTPPLSPKGAYQAAAGDPKRFKIPFTFTAPDLEGYLLPETYMVPATGFEPEGLIQRQLDSFNAKFASPYADEIAKSGHTLHELVIVASMLEREEPKPENRPIIAGIIYKRLTKKYPLGIDATSRYSLPDWNDRAKFLGKLRDPNDPYNTRLRPGLPAGPIGSPTLASLLAALRPTASEWLYYLHDKNHDVHFAKNAEAHEANRKQFDIY